MNLLLGCTGSVATIKLIKLVKEITARFENVKITIVLTKNAQYFVKEEEKKYFESAAIPLYTDEDEWESWKKIGDSIIHIELVKWADIMLLAPLDANTMAKLATGICDNLMTCLCRAWNFSKPLIYAPAMNTQMWNHPVTKTHTDTLASWKYVMIPPIVKMLACGDEGIGAMEEVSKIVDALAPYFQIIDSKIE